MKTSHINQQLELDHGDIDELTMVLPALETYQPWRLTMGYLPKIENGILTNRKGD